MTTTKKKKIKTNLHNSAPYLITFPNMFEDSFNDPELARELIQYHTENERESLVDISTDYITEAILNPKAMNHRLHGYLKDIMQLLNIYFIPNSPVQTLDSWNDTVWIRKYSPSKEKEKEKEKEEAIMHMDYNIDQKNNEYAIAEGYSPQPDVATLSVTLNKGYVGGQVIISAGYNEKGEQKTLISDATKTNIGDGIVWDGWTRHGVRPVIAGSRYAMVVHFRGTTIFPPLDRKHFKEEEEETL